MPAPPSSTPARRARFLNLALLVGGYGVGQGSIFLVQTWLLARGQLELLALFGTHFAFAIFGIIVVEAGSLTTLARHAASLDTGGESVPAMWQVFWETSLFRAGLAAIVIAASAVAAALAANPFTSAYALYASPAFLLWAIGASGVLDGLRLSGVSGVSGSLAYALQALALLFAPGLDPGRAGALLGAAFTAGYLLTVLAQFAALHASGSRARFVTPTGRGIAVAARDGLALLGGTLPGQAYFRIQLLICSAWLGPAPTALLVYIKQIVNAATQLIGFARRIEFPALVRTLADTTDDLAATIWREQLLGTRLALAGTGCMALGGLVATAFADGIAADVGAFLALYSPMAVLSAVFLAFTQGLAALRRYRAILVLSLIWTTAGLVLSILLIHLGLIGLLTAELTTALLAIALARRALVARR